VVWESQTYRNQKYIIKIIKRVLKSNQHLFNPSFAWRKGWQKNGQRVIANENFAIDSGEFDGLLEEQLVYGSRLTKQ